MNEKELHDTLMELSTMPLQDVARIMKELSIALQEESQKQLQVFSDGEPDAVGLAKVLVEAAAVSGAATALGIVADLMFKLTAELKAGNL